MVSLLLGSWSHGGFAYQSAGEKEQYLGKHYTCYDRASTERILGPQMHPDTVTNFLRFLPRIGLQTIAWSS